MGVASTLVTLEQLIEWALDQLERPQERAESAPLPAALPADPIVLTTIPDLQLDKTDFIEIGSTLYRVHDKSDDAEPVYTLYAGYLNTPIVAQLQGATVWKNPVWSRYRVRKAVLRSLYRLTSLLPNVTSETYNREPGKRIVEMPTTTIDVREVGHWNEIMDAYIEEGGWEFKQNLPTTVSSTGMGVLIPQGINDTDDLIITRIQRWAFDTADPAEDDEISVPAGCEDLPALWAAAFLAAGRELSKAESDYVEKSLNDQKQRTGSPDRIARQLWQDFYQQVAQARKIIHVPTYRPYRKMPRASAWR